MRKQNSTLKTAFISEAGSELENNDYFAYVELDQFACYVVADGLNELPDAKSARLAIETVILAFQEHPSMRKRAMQSYLKAANQALLHSDSRNRLKASVTVALTDYVKLRYGCVGNTRLKLYRDGIVKERTWDMSLTRDLLKEQKIPEDVLARHEERNNLYCYLGQEREFTPFISKKIKLSAGDIVALYTRGIWENVDDGELDDVFSEAKDDPQESLDNVEDMLLSKQPADLENYTFAAVFIDKVFQDPNRKRRIKKIIIISVVAAVIILVICLALWFMHRRKVKRLEELNLNYTNTIEYIQDNNYVRAKEECEAALKAALKLKDKKRIAQITDYQKLIEAVNEADKTFGEKKYEEAQADYVTAKERSRYADRVADEYIDSQLEHITDYLSVFDYIALGDTLASKGDFERAEEKYLEAKSLATKTYYEDGRKEAIEALEKMYADKGKAEEADTQEAKAKASDETGAAGLVSQGDKAFAEGDYEAAKTYYAMALEKYQQLGDSAHVDLINTKMGASDKKSADQQSKEGQAEGYVAAAKEQEEAKEYLEAKKQYLFAKNLYKELKKDDKVTEVTGQIELLDAKIELDRVEKERLAAEEKAREESEAAVKAAEEAASYIEGPAGDIERKKAGVN